jgi:hypothetical protein
MKQWLSILLLAILADTGVCQNAKPPLVEPVLPIGRRVFVDPFPEPLGFFSPVNGPISLSDEGRRLVDNAVFWNWMSIGGFGASTLRLIVTIVFRSDDSTDGNDRTTGGLMSLMSTGFWTISNLASAFNHWSISNDIDINGSDDPPPTTAGIASLVGGILGVGAVTAISLAFSDDTGNAETAAYIAFGLSSVAGGYGIFKAFEYAHATGADLSFF